MDILSTTALESNKNIKLNFDGGDLSSDSGLILLKEFAAKVGFIRTVKTHFKTQDTALFRRHTDCDNLMQMIYQITAGYFEDDCSDELAKDPILTSLLDKDSLASQPTISRFFSRMDKSTLTQTENIGICMREKIYAIKKPEQMLFDLDTTLFPTYGEQEGNGFNAHYQADGYHPLLCYDGLTGDLLKAELREGAKYCSKDAEWFMRPLLEEFRTKYPELPLYARGDSGFASPELYEALEDNACKYAIRLKDNPKLRELATYADEDLFDATKADQISHAVVYGEFMYQAKSWSHPRRVCFKIEKPYGQIVHLYTFIVTTMEDLEPYQVIRFYCNRGRMENFIGEGKSGFDFASVSSHSMEVNASRLALHVLAYNLFNWFRRIVLPASLRKCRIETIRLKLLKIASRVVHSARYTIFKLCSSCPYKKEFYETLSNIRNLQPKPE